MKDQMHEIKEENFEVKKANGQVIRGAVFRPVDVEGKIPSLIFSHGFGGNHNFLAHHGRGLAEAGFVCFMQDFCGGGM
ncbi:MAG: hypothetical protein K6E91_00195 [Butyrivibrio sp.]|nr:hypothetical protein [Butyrivibrio sp.]